VLVAYATRHGTTRGIAERIAATLCAAGHQAEARPVTSAGDLSAYDAFVVGSAAYMFHWLKEATQFVRRNRAVLAARPTWLFSSGPLGEGALDEEGRDKRVTSLAKEIPELREAVAARDHANFFGAWDRSWKPVGMAERFILAMPAARAAFPDGDFRDWPEIEAWAAGIARDLQPVGGPVTAA
jgi:menaquinone-dependent protoporphyrinogen oxidase